MSNAPSESADPAEIAKFEQLAHRFWDSDGEFKPLHRLNPIRAEYIVARSSPDGARVLDVGCGGGLLAEALTRKGAQVTGIDLAPAMIDTARLHAAESGLGIDYRVQDAAALANSLDQRFDIVCCMEMLEHVADPQAFVAVLARLVRPGGAVFVSTLNRNLKSFMLAIVGAEYLLRLLPRGTHEYDRFIRPAELAAYARAAGLGLQHTAGLHYEPFSDRCRLTDDVAVNYIAHLATPGST
ncbi:MAG: bifunctional 2-polyprenyl-6-hydroxyphenol methylase/3-demethylubiquinol 3-O-methyltransferase UbiG [Steroidobacteraceae bacterium]